MRKLFKHMPKNGTASIVLAVVTAITTAAVILKDPMIIKNLKKESN